MSCSLDRMASLSKQKNSDPVGLVEEFALDHGWSTERFQGHELWAELPSQWGVQRLWVVFYEETAFLQFNCYLNLKVPVRHMARAAQTVLLMNERVWLGHFEVWGEERAPMFRVVLPLRASELSEEQLEDIMASIVEETDRFFPAIQWVVWGGKTPEEAIAAAIVETEGEA